MTRAWRTGCGLEAHRSEASKATRRVRTIPARTLVPALPTFKSVERRRPKLELIVLLSIGMPFSGKAVPRSASE